MAKYTVIRPDFEWRGVVHVVAEPGDELDRMGIFELYVELLDTLPHPGVPDTARKAWVFERLEDVGDPACASTQNVPEQTHDQTTLARAAVREYIVRTRRSAAHANP